MNRISALDIQIQQVILNYLRKPIHDQLKEDVTGSVRSQVLFKLYYPLDSVVDFDQLRTTISNKIYSKK